MKLTPTQQRMYALLSDGRPHRPEELQACLMDELGNVTNVRAHLTALRKIIRPIGEDVAHWHPENVYVLVRMIANS